VHPKCTTTFWQCRAILSKCKKAVQNRQIFSRLIIAASNKGNSGRRHHQTKLPGYSASNEACNRATILVDRVGGKEFYLFI
jgi:hypothetical protein